jgi:hypothetical protein
MRIKIIGDNNCARATRHLLRLAGFAVTEFLPADAVTQGPHAGFAITIDLAPAHLTPDAHLRPDHPTHHQHASASEEAPRSHRGASSPSFVRQAQGRTSAGAPAFAKDPADLSASLEGSEFAQTDSHPVILSEARNLSGSEPERQRDSSAKHAPQNDSSLTFHAIHPGSAHIHFDSVDSALEAAVVRHVTQLAASPVIVDRPGGVVHSDRELRIIAPNTGDIQADEAAAVAIEFGVLPGLLDLSGPGPSSASLSKKFVDGDGTDEAGEPAEAPPILRSEGGWKWWWPFGVLLLAGTLGLLRASHAAAPGRGVEGVGKTHRLKPAPLKPALLEAASLAGVLEIHRLKSVLLDAALLEPAQEQMATGQGFKITDGTNFLVVDPCKGQAKLYASISQTGNTQLVAGTASKKIYVCSIHVVAAAAADVAVVEGTGSVCGTSTAGVSGFGGATAATGWNFAGNGGIALGNGDSSLGAEETGGDNLCIFNSGSGQVSGGISYVVE